MQDINSFGIEALLYLDWHGIPVEKTPAQYRYSFDPYVTYKKADKYEHAVYSDRLYQWDWDKHNDLCKKHFGNSGQNWTNRSPKKVEAFLRDYHDDQKLELVGIMHGCNVSNGFPYWIFMINTNK